jgi:predicted metalloendopeptidase
MTRFSFFALSAAALIAASAARADSAAVSGIQIADMDTSVRPQDKAFIASLNGRAPPVIDGMTADQRFYLGYAQSWLGKQRDAAMIAQLASNPHAPEKYRVNGVVVHLPSFYSAFSVASGDKMYIAPEERVTLW